MHSSMHIHTQMKTKLVCTRQPQFSDLADRTEEEEEEEGEERNKNMLGVPRQRLRLL